MDQIFQCGGDRVNGGNQADMTTGAGQPLDLADLADLGRRAGQAQSQREESR
jgi:hypothetical protein